jgi:MFS family permease
MTDIGRTVIVPGDQPLSPTPAGDPRRWKALFVLALMQFMLVLDITVVNVALPHIQTDLGFSRSGLAWVVDAYVLTAGGLLLLGGRLADLLGRRRMFLIGCVAFAVTSAASGAAIDPGMLIASRFAQGACEALAAPAAFGLVALLFPDAKERAKAIGIFGTFMTLVSPARLRLTVRPVVCGGCCEERSVGPRRHSTGLLLSTSCGPGWKKRSAWPSSGAGWLGSRGPRWVLWLGSAVKRLTTGGVPRSPGTRGSASWRATPPTGQTYNAC